MSACERLITCTHVIGPDGPMTGALSISIGDDRMATTKPATGMASKRLLALPALVNAHDHGGAVLTGSIGADAKPPESWLHCLALLHQSGCNRTPAISEPTRRSAKS